MGVKEFFQRLRERKEAKKEMFQQAEAQMRIQQLLEERQKSANQREMERYDKEDYEKAIKERLDYMRKKREHDISFNHNPLDAPNITNHVDWEVLKERNMFKGKRNSFSNQKFIHKDNKKLLKNNKKLFGI